MFSGSQRVKPPISALSQPAATGKRTMARRKSRSAVIDVARHTYLSGITRTHASHSLVSVFAQTVFVRRIGNGYRIGGRFVLTAVVSGLAPERRVRDESDITRSTVEASIRRRRLVHAYL